jgi:hypothetical protein
MEKHFSILLGITVLLAAAVACRPIIAIGWPELILLTVLIVVLLGPLLFRLYRFLDKVQKATRSEEKKEK